MHELQSNNTMIPKHDDLRSVHKRQKSNRQKLTISSVVSPSTLESIKAIEASMTLVSIAASASLDSWLALGSNRSIVSLLSVVTSLSGRSRLSLLSLVSRVTYANNMRS